MPRLPGSRPQSNQIPTVALAFMACLVLGGGFFGLLAVILPGVGMMALIGFLFVVFFWAQYLIWGKRLYAYAVRLEARYEPASTTETSPSAVNQQQQQQQQQQ